MQFRLALAISLFAGSASAQQPDFEAEVRTRTCAFAAAIENGTQALIKEFNEQAVLFPPNSRENLSRLFEQQLGSNKLGEVSAYSLGSLPGRFAETMLYHTPEQVAPIFFRLRYAQTREGATHLVNVEYNTSYEEVTKVQFLAPPTVMECPEGN